MRTIRNYRLSDHNAAWRRSSAARRRSSVAWPQRSGSRRSGARLTRSSSVASGLASAASPQRPRLGGLALASCYRHRSPATWPQRPGVGAPHARCPASARLRPIALRLMPVACRPQASVRLASRGADRRRPHAILCGKVVTQPHSLLIAHSPVNPTQLIRIATREVTENEMSALLYGFS
jgi:hypothetical protein